MPHKQTQSTDDVVRGISEAVDMLSSSFSTPRPRPAPRGRSKQKMRLLWGATSFLSLLVFGMWIWNARTIWYDVSHTPSEESALFRDATEDATQIFAAFQGRVTEAFAEEVVGTAEAQDTQMIEAAVTDALRAIVTTSTSSTVPIDITTTTESGPTTTQRATTDYRLPITN